MTPNQLNLIICLGGSLLFVFVLVFHLVQIGMEKKLLDKLGKEYPKVKSSYIFCLICCGVVCALPYLILFKPFITAVLEGCGIFGSWTILKERAENLKKLEEN